MKVERSKMADIPIGAVAAAIIGAGASLISLIITKQNKKSEFRQAWVDALRTDIAEGIAAISLLLALFKQPLDNERKLSGELFEAWSRIRVALARVQLRLNMAEDDHANFAALIRRTELLLSDAMSDKYSVEQTEALEDNTIELSQSILKRE